MFSRALLLLGLVACASCSSSSSSDDDDDDDGDSTVTPDAGSRLGTYRRVVPGFASEEACRAANPDPIFHCVEVLDLCADGVAAVLLTDIVTPGTWSESPGHVLVNAPGSGLGEDGVVDFEVRADGSLHSAEVYGDRAYVPSSEPLESLCQPRE